MGIGKKMGENEPMLKEGQEGKKLFHIFTLLGVAKDACMCPHCLYLRRSKYLMFFQPYNTGNEQHFSDYI